MNGTPNRFDYVEYDEASMALQGRFKSAIQIIERMVDELEPGRSRELAYIKLEEAYMWIGKAVRDEQIARNKTTELQEERNNE